MYVFLRKKKKIRPTKNHGLDSEIAAPGSTGGCGWMITISHSSLESYKSMEGKQSIIWTRAIQTLKPASLSSIFSGRDECSTRACLFFAELVRCVPIKNTANSPANLIAFNKNLHILDSRILIYTCTTQGKKEGTR